MELSKVIRLFTVLSVFFVANALIAEFIGIKIFSLEKTFDIAPLELSFLGNTSLSLDLTAGVILWPVVFLMTDIINEYFGKEKVKFLSYVTVGIILYAFIAITIAINVTPNDWWKNESGKLMNSGVVEDMDLAFRAVFGQSNWIIIGSIIAFLVGQLVDVYVFQSLKRFSKGRFIWLRATGSTLVSQLIDSYVVLLIAFYMGSDWSLDRVLAIGSMNYMYKFCCALLLTPLVYLAHYIIDSYLGEKTAANLKKEANL